jgi:hypothetical protein
MSKGKTDREMVREFFEWEWPARSYASLKWGIGLIAAGVLMTGQVLIVGLLGMVTGGFFVYDYFSSSNLLRTPVGKNLEKVRENRFRDLVKIWVRSYDKIDKSIAELRQFDLTDYHPLDGASVDFDSLTRSPVSLSEIKSRSVFIFGPIHKAKIQIGVSRNGITIEYNPINVSILYIAGNQLIVYHAVADLITGDLRSESIQRIYLAQIVQVGVWTNSERIKATEAESAGLLKKFNRARSLEAKELVLSETLVRITKTDGGTLDFPIGAPTVKDGTKGVLDTDDVSENREVRIARALDQNIESAKRLTIGRPDRSPDGV